MTAKELWRFAPRLHMRIDPERAMAVQRELMPPELQRKMIAAFERARAERLAAQIPQQAAGRAGDPWTRANTAAFLILERERRAIATRLCSSYRRPGDRYRDLILVTRLIHLEYEHLAGRVGGRAGPPASSNGAPSNGAPSNGAPSNDLQVGGDMPADWARPWGSGPMVEIGTAFAFYRDQRDRLARQLSTPILGSAAAAAAQQRDRILTRFEGAMGEWRPELEHGRGAAADSGKRQAAPSIAEAARDEKPGWPWTSLGLTRRAVAAGAVAAVFVAVGVGAIFATRGGESPTGAPSPVVASVPKPLEALRDSQPARGRGGQHGAAHRSRSPQRGQSNTGGAPEADQTALTTASETPPPAPEPASEAAPDPVAPADPVATPAPPPPPPPDDAPAPEPQPDPKPRPDPVSSLPPPVGSLPGPGRSGDGGG